MSDTAIRSWAVMLAGSLLALAGCGGGGGGTSNVPLSPAAPAPTPLRGIPPLNFQSPNTTVTYQAAAVTAVGANSSVGNIAVSAAGQGATITLVTDANGNLTGMAIPAGGITSAMTGGFGFASSLASSDTLAVSFLDSFNSANQISYTISQVAAGQGLTSSAYGMWTSTIPPHQDAGTFAIGNLTAPTSVPTTGSATYNGFAIAAGGAINGGLTYFVKGNAQIIANFGAQSVTTNLSNFNSLAYEPTPPTPVANFTGTSTISGNAYAGTISGGGMTGSINGNFYGSAAQETAGVWQASGGGSALIGSFGAKQ